MATRHLLLLELLAERSNSSSKMAISLSLSGSKFAAVTQCRYVQRFRACAQFKEFGGKNAIDVLRMRESN